METVKLRAKVGPHEFEAEGPKDAVTSQFEAWRSLIGNVHADAPTPATPTPTPGSPEPPAPPTNGITTAQLAHVFDLDEKRGLVSLRVLPTGDRRHADAVLLVLYGYRRLRNEDDILVTRLMAALETSGSRPERIDRVAESYRQEGFFVKSGKAKGGRYRLTNKGIAKAEEMVRGLLEQLT